MAGIGVESASQGSSGSLTLAFGLLGFLMIPLRHKQRRCASLIAAAILMMGAALAGCGGGSSGGAAGQSLNASTQKIVAVNVSVNGKQLPVANLPTDLGTIRRK